MFLETIKNVLPLTREWIEMARIISRTKRPKVLPLTREWIEIRLSQMQPPSQLIVLPLTREWIEIKPTVQKSANCLKFSLLRGSGLKFLIFLVEVRVNLFSLLRGSGLK